MNKAKLVLQIIELLERESENLARAAKIAHADATGEESKSENKYDTRGLEASYLAGAQSAMASESKLNLAIYKKLELKEFTNDSKIALTALITLESENGDLHFYFLGPNSGGIKLEQDDKKILVITPPSPIGQKLIGREVEDFIEIRSDGEDKKYKIVTIC